MDGEFGYEHADNPAVRKLLNMLLLLMLTDEHDELSIRPIDGEARVLMDLDELTAPPRELLPGIVDRLKIMAMLDPDEDSVEQTGRFELELEAGIIRARVQTIPSPEGEGVLVVREG